MGAPEAVGGDATRTEDIGVPEGGEEVYFFTSQYRQFLSNLKTYKVTFSTPIKNTKFNMYNLF